MITKPYLSELLRIATGDSSVRLQSWNQAPVRGGFGSAIGGTALYRFTLETDAGNTISLILKVLNRRPGETEASPYYWKREYEFYRAGILENMPARSFSAPRIYHVEDHVDACWIWMADIAATEEDWSLRDFADVARRLGRFNGWWLAGSELPDASWLSSDWHSALVPALADTFAQIDQLVADPLVQLTLPLDAIGEIESIWRERENFRQALSMLPRTLCHYDAFRRNILYRDDDVFLIDWALVGIGGIGEDLVSLVAVSLYYAGYSHEYAIELDRTVFANYVSGLREAGWRGDQRLARIGYTCGMTLRGLAGVKQDINLLSHTANHEQLRRDHDSENLEDIARFFAEIRRFRLLRMAHEARSLLSG